MPCGHCAQCAKKTQNDWYIRIFEESKNWTNSVFFTLTYNEESVPIVTDEQGNSYHSVCREDIQKFMKRLRKQLCARHGNDFRVKYFICSEYGPKTLRPHYHGILFGLPDCDISLINSCWSLGFVNVSRVKSVGSFRYVSKYCSKPAVFRYENKAPVERTFRLVSHGLGKSYCSDLQNLAFHKSDIYGHHYYFTNGFKYGLPRYYTQKLFTNQENLEYKRLQELEAVKQWRFRFGSYEWLDNRKIIVQTPFQLSQSHNEDLIKFNQSDGVDLMYFQKTCSKSIF